uniref:Uncharacterized protein n=1 Tax=Seriola lalandi dorsalis TaxID=1841481 RepID=A0A3B4X382_SERLL
MLIIAALILLPLFIRKDKDFQTVFIFPEGHCSHFITEFSKRQSKLQSLLTKLKDIAIRLDKVNKGIKIAYVAGSSVGAIGSVLSIVGLALSPLTLGASLPLTMAGLGMGIACGVSSAVTTSTKIGVNRKQQKKAACVFQSIKKDVESIQQCLEEVKMEKGKPDVTLGVTSVVLNVGNLGYNVHNIVECGAGGVCDVVEISADIGQAVASAGLAARAFLLVFDVCSIIKNCVSLAKDAESEASQPIRDSADLLQSVIDSWQEIYESLIRGQKTFEENKAI